MYGDAGTMYYDSLDALMRVVLPLLPDATFSEDSDGEILIHTNLRISDGLTSVAADELEPITLRTLLGTGKVPTND